ncbi:MAG TPA: DUF2062 domain-containing protein [Polyangia bacterium]|nr:DUF2062 domain-containing protein [Polyangia bacterium]
MLSRVKNLVRALLRQHTSPARLAAAVLVGCVVGCTPLFGLHILICVALAWLLRLNQVAVYAAANVSLPPLVPLLGFASVQLGERLLHRRWLALARADFTWSGAPALARRFFADWLVGGVAVGAALGVALGAIVYVVAAARRRARAAAIDPVDAAIETAAGRYRAAHPRFRWYARLKYQMDPCYRAIAPLVGERDVTVDLGTGLAMLPVLLGVLGRRALGVEWDRAKAAAGVEAARGLDGIEVIEGDLRAFALPACDVVTLVDVLHYYDAGEQRALLERCARALRPGGRILVREGDRARRGGARFTRLLERVVTRLGWNRGPRVRFRPIDELRADLESLGLRVRTDEVAGRLHPGNVLLIAERNG